MAGIAIIGYGYWGPNLVRNFSSVSNSKVEWVIDLRAERLEVIKKQYPNVRTSANLDDALNDPAVTAVVPSRIARPASSLRRRCRTKLSPSIRRNMAATFRRL